MYITKHPFYTDIFVVYIISYENLISSNVANLFYYYVIPNTNLAIGQKFFTQCSPMIPFKVKLR